MLPEHCKDVSVREVSFPLNKEEIMRHAEGKKAYTRTRFIILRNKKEHAILHVEKEEGKELFRPIVSVELLALPKDTVFVRDDDLDVLNLSQMVRVAKGYHGKYVIVQGLFNHVSFIKAEDGMELEVFDVVPPEPSKLSVLVDRALVAGLVDLPIVPCVKVVDLNELERGVATPDVLFPCRASGITSKREVLFLDETPEITREVTLIGCDLSKRIFQHIYRQRPAHFINMCPRDLAPKDGKKRIVKCCRLREGFEIEGSTAMVPWGATVLEVAEAINSLFKG